LYPTVSLPSMETLDIGDKKWGEKYGCNVNKSSLDLFVVGENLYEKKTVNGINMY
jgi:hypothetical protein